MFANNSVPKQTDTESDIEFSQSIDNKQEELFLLKQLRRKRREKTDGIIAARIAAQTFTPSTLMFHQDLSLTAAQALREFTDEEKTQIDELFADLGNSEEGQYKQELIETVIGDNAIYFKLVTNPVFIIRDGLIIDKKTALELLDQSPVRPSPRTARTFVEGEIIPCNTIILVMQELLNIYNQTADDLTYLEIDESVKIPYQKLTVADLIAIEKYYDTLPVSHQRLFNLVCRGANGHILEEPVLLPDGFVYEKCLVLEWLKTAAAEKRECFCPNSQIVFTENEITLCDFAVVTVNKIRDRLAAAAALVAVKAGSVATTGHFSPTGAVSVALSAEKEAIRQDLIGEIRYLKIALGFAPRPAQPMENNFLRLAFQKDKYAIPLAQADLKDSSMGVILDEAIKALNTLDYPTLKKSRNAKPNCTLVRTMLGGHCSLHNNLYARYVADGLGTIDFQPGWYVHNALVKVKATIKSLLKNDLSPKKMG